MQESKVDSKTSQKQQLVETEAEKLETIEKERNWRFLKQKFLGLVLTQMARNLLFTGEQCVSYRLYSSNRWKVTFVRERKIDWIFFLERTCLANKRSCSIKWILWIQSWGFFAGLWIR